MLYEVTHAGQTFRRESHLVYTHVVFALERRTGSWEAAWSRNLLNAQGAAARKRKQSYVETVHVREVEAIATPACLERMAIYANACWQFKADARYPQYVELTEATEAALKAWDPHGGIVLDHDTDKAMRDTWMTAVNAEKALHKAIWDDAMKAAPLAVRAVAP